MTVSSLLYDVARGRGGHPAAVVGLAWLVGGLGLGSSLEPRSGRPRQPRELPGAALSVGFGQISRTFGQGRRFPRRLAGG